jgi:uncharacterized protein (TIGR02001 family)
VIACAGLFARQGRANVRGAWLLRAVFAGVAGLGIAAPAYAEVGAAVSVFSDSRFRGYSISDHHPVALLDLSYDDSSGLYVAASAGAVAELDEVRPLGLQVNGGYSRHLPSGVTLDLGIVHSKYSRYSSAAGNSYTEVYAGLTRKCLTGRVHVSPHYFGAGTWTAYGEVDCNVSLGRKLSFDGHVGMLVPFRNRSADTRAASAYDWRIGMSRQFGRFSTHAAWTGGRVFRRYDGDGRRRTGALIFGVSFVL